VSDRPASDGGDARVDELRHQLKRLGYLDAGVDRFVLGPAHDRRSPFVIAMLASLRIGVIAAVLLGPAAAIGIGSRVPGLVTGPRDAAIVALYLAVLFGAAVTVAAFVAGLLIASAARSLASRGARVLALTAGTMVSLACLTYLTLWWRTANAGPEWSAPIWTAVALLVAVAISLLLGHAVTLMALAVIMARETSGSAPAIAASSLFSWKLSLGAGVLAFAGAVLLLLTAPVESHDARPVPALTVVPSGLRVRLIAIDGFDSTIFDAMSSEGRVPALTAAHAGARARLAAEDTRDPARAWTTIATGQPAHVHGVYGLETRRLPGVQGSVPSVAPSRAARAIQAATDLVRLTRPSVASGEERRAKTLWEVAADSGLRTVVVNWWATWPAPAQSTATILSDRATLRLELGGALDAEIVPAELYERLRVQWTGIRRKASERTQQMPVPADRATADVVGRSAALDALQLTLAEYVQGRDADLIAVYLPGLDIAQHTLFGRSTSALTPSAVAARVEALRDYYIFIDRLLQDVLVPAAGELVFVVTEPGRVTSASAGRLAMTGVTARPGARVEASAIDLMPTVLYALGLPHSRELSGRSLVELFVTDHVARYPVREIATYGRPSSGSGRRGGQPLDEEMLERLRSLGYVR
jgi:Type I phosphodiesterase / nucleotide pyrophosphatase